MIIRTKVQGGTWDKRDRNANALLYAIGATKFGGKVTHIANDVYEFDVPQAFTCQHPAIRYLIEHA